MTRTIAAHRDLTTDPGLVAALTAASPGGVDIRASRRLALAHDASHYLLTPQAIVTPADITEVAALLRLSSQHRVSFTFRSGGTSLSGQAVSEGVLVDTRRHFRDIEVLDDGTRVRVQPGITVRQVNARLSPHKRKLGPDPASESACTIGGVVANNSSGMACGVEFNTYQTLESATLVLPSGTIIDTGAKDADALLRDREPELYSGLLTLRDRVRNNPHSVRTIRKLYSIKNTMGYGLNSFLDHDRAVDILAHLVIGSEGTLAFVGEAIFRTIPVKAHTATGLLVFQNMRDAVQSLPELVAAGFATVELLDATSLKVSQRDKGANVLLRELEVGQQSALLVEYQESDAGELKQRISESRQLFSSLPLQTPAQLTEDAKARAALWHIRKGLYAAIAGNRPVGTSALLEDIAVPMTALLDTCERLTELFVKHGYEDNVIFGHAKDGNLHFMLNEHFGDTDKLARYIAFTEDMVQLVLSGDGTLKAEHGTGRVMAPFVRRQYGDELYEVMQEIKRLCDPRTVLNPGVLLNEDAASAVQHLKVARPVEKEVDRCVECGYCEPVCPSKDLTLTPRQRIVLRRELADANAVGDVELVRALEADYRYEGVDTCAVDGMCLTACPVDINTGDLVRRLRAETNGPLAQAGWKQTARHWNTVTRLGGAALNVAKVMPAPLVTGVTTVARAILGADTVPRWQKDLPAGGTARKPRQAAEPRAVYFPACIGTMFGPVKGASGVGNSLLELCERVDIELIVPEGIQSLCCGTPWKSKGMTEGYDDMRSRVLPILWEASRHGELPIVVDATSCTEGLAIMVADSSDLAIQYPSMHVIDAIEFVDDAIMPLITVQRRLESLSLHPTCSSTQLGTNDALSRLAEAIADDVVVPDDWGCCGFAGDRGMLHPELTKSATHSETASVLQREFTAYASTNRTCEIGMSRATGHDYRHLLELINEATR
jgi:D-lactate dehydrogenase